MDKQILTKIMARVNLSGKLNETTNNKAKKNTIATTTTIFATTQDTSN